tara:strand:- start:2683 stop:3366 length:684 start_codon:yes stop_codon:yes gene_type:complete
MDEEKNIIIEKLSDSLIFSNFSLINFSFNLLIAIFFSLLIGYTYTKYGRNISNRKEFASNFTLLTVTTMFIITIVKSSLALSLGLVGALSIVRFRAAIKDPEELTYLFFSIAIGLGLGANQLSATIITSLVTFIFIFIRDKFSKNSREKFANLIINSPKVKNHNIDDLITMLLNYTNNVDLRRYTEDENNYELFIDLNIDSFNQTQNLFNEISKSFPGITLDFIDKS